MTNQETCIDKIGREANIVCGGTLQGAVDEAWKRAQNPASLCGTVAKDVMMAAGTAAVITIAPEIVLPMFACAATAMLLEDRTEQKKAWAKDARLFEACKSAWNDPTKEEAAKKVFANELGKQTFEASLMCMTMFSGFGLGTRFAEGKIAQFAESGLASKRMVISDLGQGAFETKLRDSVVTTRGDGTVIKHFENGRIQRHIPTGNGDYIFTDLRPSGVLTTDLPGGNRIIKLHTGRIYSFESKGGYEVQKQSGLRMWANADDSVRTFTHPNGTMTRFTGTEKERIFQPKDASF
ncbi:hypothetical protein BH10CYA1_BH10CYA1_03320 [soil metagenome]